MTQFPVDQAFELHSLATALAERGQPEEAAKACEAALAILVKECGGAHPDVACVRLDLGGIYESLGRLAEADDSYAEADEALQAYARERDAALLRLRVRARTKRAAAARRLGRADEAELLLLSAIDIAASIA